MSLSALRLVTTTSTVSQWPAAWRMRSSSVRGSPGAATERASSRPARSASSGWTRWIGLAVGSSGSARTKPARPSTEKARLPSGSSTVTVSVTFCRSLRSRLSSPEAFAGRLGLDQVVGQCVEGVAAIGGVVEAGDQPAAAGPVERSQEHADPADGTVEPLVPELGLDGLVGRDRSGDVAVGQGRGRPGGPGRRGPGRRGRRSDARTTRPPRRWPRARCRPGRTAARPDELAPGRGDEPFPVQEARRILGLAVLTTPARMVVTVDLSVLPRPDLRSTAPACPRARHLIGGGCDGLSPPQS